MVGQVESQSERASMPKWQRVFCGVLAVTGISALPFVVWAVFHGDFHFLRAFSILGGSGMGFFLFGFAAFKGRLPNFMVRPHQGNR